jgi:ribonuclease E
MLVYEEGSLIKRSIRDLYNKDIDAIVVAGEDAYHEAKEFMRLLMPSHAKMVQPYRDPQPMFAKSGAETQLDAMFSNQVTLKSGGYVVINQTEALVAIDVNSGRSTREHNIEDTALRTNLEAADEISRQLRLRDLAGLIVIDFIDMEENRNNRAVERRLKDALKNDRARIQIGRLSHFGLLEMSRQRMRTGVIEGSTVVCPHCAGAGMMRSTASIALHVLRVLEDALIKNSSYDLTVNTRTAVALYILNQKRAHLRDLEKRFGASLTIAADDGLTGTNYYTLERGEPAAGAKENPAFAPEEEPRAAMADSVFDEPADTGEGPPEASPVEEPRDGGVEPSDSENEADGGQRRRRRRRRGRGGDREGSGIAANAPQPPDDALEAMAQIGGLRRSRALESEAETGQAPFPGNDETEASHRDGRRRSRRGGRAPRETSGNLAAGPTDAAELEFKPETDALGGDMGEKGAGKARRGRRTPRAPRAGRGREAAVAPNAASATDVRQVQAQAVAPQRDDVEASPASGKADAREAPQSAPSDVDTVLGRDEIPSRLGESSRVDVVDPARTKRSGWWQRARAS